MWIKTAYGELVNLQTALKVQVSKIEAKISGLDDAAHVEAVFGLVDAERPLYIVPLTGEMPREEAEQFRDELFKAIRRGDATFPKEKPAMSEHGAF